MQYHNAERRHPWKFVVVNFLLSCMLAMYVALGIAGLAGTDPVSGNDVIFAVLAVCASFSLGFYFIWLRVRAVRFERQVEDVLPGWFASYEGEYNRLQTLYGDICATARLLQPESAFPQAARSVLSDAHRVMLQEYERLCRQHRERFDSIKQNKLLEPRIYLLAAVPHEEFPLPQCV